MNLDRRLHHTSTQGRGEVDQPTNQPTTKPTTLYHGGIILLFITLSLLKKSLAFINQAKLKQIYTIKHT